MGSATGPADVPLGSDGGRLRLLAALVAYNAALLLCLPGVVLWLAWRLLVKHKPMGSWRNRLGLVPRVAGHAGERIWVHAVSAGEMAAAQPVLTALRRRYPDALIAVSTHTDTGMAVARRSCARADALLYVPFDVPPCVGAALWRVRPHLLVVVEKELWPNLLGLARLLGSRVLLVNGRVSERMMLRRRWMAPFVGWLWRLPELLCLQSAQDAERLRRLSANERGVLIVGNTKADSLARPDSSAEARLRSALAVVDGEHWLVAGSTHPGEEAVVVEAFRRIRRSSPSARLLLAPRHPERAAEVSAMLKQRGMEAARRSTVAHGWRGAVTVLDTMGELRAAYGFATAGFVGGTLVPVGGHNLLEPVAAGRAVLFGPHTENCADIADLVLEHRVGHLVRTAEEIAQTFVEIASDGALQDRISAGARSLIEQQRGASERCAEQAVILLSERRSR